MIDVEKQIAEVIDYNEFADKLKFESSKWHVGSREARLMNEAADVIRTLLSSAQSGEQAAVSTLAKTWPTEGMTSAFGEKFSTRRQRETFPAAFKAAISVAPFPSEVIGLLDALESMVDVCEGHDFDGAPSDAHMEKARAAISAYRCLAASQPNGEAA